MTPRDRLAERLLATFLEELDDNVRLLNADLLALEANPEDAGRLRSVFRAVHTLKGASRAAGVSEVEAMCHRAESFLAEVRDGRAVLQAGQVALLLQMADRLEAIGAGLRGGGAAAAGTSAGGPPPEFQSSIDSPGDRHHSIPAVPPALPAGGAMGVAATPAAPPSADTGEPSAESREPRAETTQLRVGAARVESLVAAAGELLDLGGALAARPAQADAHGALVRRARGEWRRLAGRLRARLADDPALVGALDAADRALGDVETDAARLARAVREDARGLTGAASRLAEDVRGLRMRPFTEVAEPLPRAARDLGVQLGKPVRLEVRGEDVQADRAVLDAVREALLHLLRNAVDHGLESPEERARAGKPAQGTITVGATVAGDHVEISVGDDGRGLDVAAVRRALARRGAAVPASDAAVAATLLRGGLSTREQATAISGRGVGLDAARAVAERLGGTLTVDWREGLGTTFTLRVPVSVATTRVLLARAGGQLFALPSSLVSRLERRRVRELRRVGARAVLPAEPEPIPVLPLAELLGATGTRAREGDDADGDRLVLAMLALPGRHLAVAVDELVDEREVVVRPLDGAGPAAGDRYAGAVIVRGEGIALVVNPAFVTAAAEREGAGAAMAAATGEQAVRRKPRVLVVDDSVTTRTLEESVLLAAGYDVVTAVDGADGLRVVRQGGVDVVVTDVEMPVLDGLALCEAIRADAATARLPVVLVTSLDKPEQRARGLEAGADAYITKSSFDQEDFLATVRQLVGGG